MAVALLVGSAPSVNAGSSTTVVFTGLVVLSGCLGFGYPGLVGPVPGITTGIDTAPYPRVSLTYTGGSNCNFGISSATCAGAAASHKKPGFFAAGPCEVDGGGTITGFCGLSSGHGTMQIDTVNGPFAVDFYLTQAGPAVLTGLITNPRTGQTGKFTAEALILPRLPFLDTSGGNCGNGAATAFTLVVHGEGESV
jgi:hypothetical protein